MNDGVKNAYNNYKKKYGVDVTLNKLTTVKALIKDSTTDNFVKEIQMSNSTMKFGDYITTFDKSADRTDTYIVRSKVLPKLYYDESEIRQCNNFLKYKATVDGVAETIVSIPCTVFEGIGSINYGQYFNTKDNTIIVEVGYSLIDYIKPIVLLFRFILNNTPWRVNFIDDATNVDNGQGTVYITLTTENELFTSEDDRVNGIASQVSSIGIPVITLPHTYTLGLSSTSMNIENTRTYQIVSTSTKDDIIVVNPALTYVSNNLSICTVSSTGLVTGITEGSTTINVIYQGITKVMNITIIAKVEIYTLLGATTINETTLQNYKMVDESGADSLLEYTFEVDESLVTIESTGTNFINIIGNNIQGSFTITVTNNSNIYTKFISTLYNSHVYTITPNVSTIEIEQGNTSQIITVCTKDGVEVVSPIVTFTSSDETIATVDNTGLIQSITIGSVSITCLYGDAQSSISVNVIAIPIKIYHIEGSDIVDAITPQRYTMVDEDGVASNDTYTIIAVPLYPNTSIGNLVDITGNGTNYREFIYGYTDDSYEGSFMITMTSNTDTSLVYTKQVWNVYTIPTYALTLPTSSVNITIGATYTPVPNPTKDGVADTIPYSGIQYVSNNNNICTVVTDADGKNPVITGIALGTTTITISYHGNVVELTVNVIAYVPHTYSISGDDTITTTAYSTYRIVNEDEVVETVVKYTYSLIKYDTHTPIDLITLGGESGTNIISFKKKTGVVSGGQFILRAKLQTDTTIYIDKLVTTI